MPRPSKTGTPPKSIASTQSLSAFVKNVCDIMRRSNCASALQYVPELTWILFLRILDAQETRQAQQAAALEVALPQLAADVSLPAADTRADPRMPDAAVPLPPDQDALPPTATAISTPPRTNIEDLFDSAPIPGLDPVSPTESTDPASPSPAR